MSFQEKRRITFLVGSLVSILIYAIVVYNGYHAGRYLTENLYQFYARVILIYIPIAIVLRILLTIFASIAYAISNEIKGEEQDDPNIVDEREQRIELKTSQASMITFMIGFIWSLLLLALGFSAHYFFLTLIGFGIVTEVLETGLNLYYYRKGV